MPFVTAQQARRIAQDCARVLVRMVKPDGRFIYRYMLTAPDRTDQAYDNIRHIGSLWAMLEIDRRLGPIEGVREAANRSSSYMTSEFLAPYAGESMLCVLDEGASKLGGAGLALNVLSLLHEAASDQEYLLLSKKLAAFILKQRQADGDFVHVRPYPVGPAFALRSNFYTGQALTGLMHYWEQTGDDEALETVRHSLAQLSKQSFGIQPMSHWMLYALERAYKATKSEDMLDYAGRIAGAIEADKRYRTAGHLTPAACSTEGLLAFDRMLEAAGYDRTSVRRTQLLGLVRQNLGIMLKFKAEGGVFIDARSHPEVRVDFIAHAGLCFLGYAIQAEGRT